MIAVIADDITGAAEIAGIAKSKGLTTRLAMTGNGIAENADTAVVCSDEEIPASSIDVVVFATDTRQMAESDAIKEVEQIVKKLPEGVMVFKKTDSVLRGHIKAECDAILQNSSYEEVLLIPQNPSKERIVRGGIYYINNVPLNETQFANDPEFPTLSADVSAFGVPDAESMEDIKALLNSRKANTLLAGGADLFSTLIEEKALPTDNQEVTREENQSNAFSVESGKTASSATNDGKLILVCGSTQSTNVVEAPLCRRHNAVECNMPADVFYGRKGVSNCEKHPIQIWKEELNSVFLGDGSNGKDGKGIVLTINYPAQGGKDFAIRLRTTMADVVKSLIEKTPNTETSPRLLLIIEGGATAFEILKTLGWSHFEVVKEHFPGVVEIANRRANIILKPGSYPWNDMLK